MGGDLPEGGTLKTFRWPSALGPQTMASVLRGDVRVAVWGWGGEG